MNRSRDELPVPLRASAPAGRSVTSLGSPLRGSAPARMPRLPTLPSLFHAEPTEESSGDAAHGRSRSGSIKSPRTMVAPQGNSPRGPALSGPHNFCAASVFRPVTCDYCGRVRTTTACFRCTSCGYTVHKRCAGVATTERTCTNVTEKTSAVPITFQPASNDARACCDPPLTRIAQRRSTAGSCQSICCPWLARACLSNKSRRARAGSGAGLFCRQTRRTCTIARRAAATRCRGAACR